MSFKFNSYSLIIIAVFVFCTTSQFAQKIPEHPIIKPFPNSVLAEKMSTYDKFNEFEFVFRCYFSHFELIDKIKPCVFILPMS